MLELTSGLGGASVVGAQWLAAWGTSLLVHVAVLAGCWWAVDTVYVQQITIFGDQIVLSAQFSESMPTLLLETSPVEVNLTVDDFTDPEQLICEPPPIPEVVVELPVEEAVPQPPTQKQVELTSQPTEAVASATPTQVGLKPIKPAEYLRNDPPEYPSMAVARGWSGKVWLRLHISETGRVDEVELVESSGHDLLDAAALAAVRKWEFHPAQNDQGPVESKAILPIRFRL